VPVHELAPWGRVFLDLRPSPEWAAIREQMERREIRPALLSGKNRGWGAAFGRRTAPGRRVQRGRTTRTVHHLPAVVRTRVIPAGGERGGGLQRIGWLDPYTARLPRTRAGRDPGRG